MREKRLQVRTHYIHRIQYSTQERLVGAFVLLAITVLVWLLFSSGKLLTDFEEQYLLYGQLESIQPIDQNTEIIIGGLSAGRVQSVKITDDNHIIVVMEILKRYQRLIRTDSVARLSALNLGMINQSFIDISVGSPQQAILDEGNTIVITETVNIKNLLVKVAPTMESLFEMINRINALLSVVEHKKLENTIDNIDSIVNTIDPSQVKDLLENVHAISNKSRDGVPVTIKSIDELISAIDLDKLENTTNHINQLLTAINPALVNESVENLHMTIADIKDISQQIKNAKGLVGSAIYDKQIQTDFKQTLINFSKASHQLDKLLSLLNKELANMPGLLNKIEPLLNEADKTIKATQKIWPISSTIENNAHKKMLTSPELIND